MKNESSSNVKKSGIHHDHILTVLICAISIPLSMSFWIFNIVYTKFIKSGEYYDDPIIISPGRWLTAFLIPILISFYGYRKNSLSKSGALSGFIVGFILTLSNYGFLAVLFTCFMSCSKATKVGGHKKQKFEEDYKEGGQRNWIQILCNGGMASQLGLLYLLDVGSTERPIDFVKDYRASWLTIGVLSVFTCCTGDTWASELGTVWAKSEPYLITTWKRVPRGTNGGVTFIGTICTALGGLLVGLSMYVALTYCADRSLLAQAPPQWPLLLFGALGGALGSLVDSVLGATLQYSGLDKNGKIVSHSSLTVNYISGRNILDNHSVNLISTVIMGLLMPSLCKVLWPSS